MLKDTNIFEIAQAVKDNLISPNDERVKRLEEALAELGSTIQGRQELAEIIGIYLTKQWPQFDISKLVTTYRNFKYGDQAEFRLKKRGIRAYWIAPNSSTPKSRNYQDTLTMEWETVSVRPEAYLQEIEAGRVQSFAELVTDAKDAMQVALVQKVMELLNQVYNETANPNLYAAVTGDLTPEALNIAIDTIGSKNGGSPVVMADYMLAQQITDFPGYSEAALEEIRRTGVIGTYRGAQIVRLPEYYDEALDTILVPQNRLFVVAKRVGYGATYGTVKSGQESSIEDWSWNARFDMTWGMTVVEPEGMYVLDVV